MINYIKGDATFPEKTSPGKNNIIIHIVNDIGSWGRGFVLALSRRWTRPEYQYRAAWKTKQLGDIQIVQVEKDIWVVNLFGQHGIKNSNYIPVRYEAIHKGLKTLSFILKDTENVAIHMPKIGCGLAGGDWNIVSKLIEDSLSGFSVYVYEL